MIFFWYLFDVINPRKNNNCSAVQHVKKKDNPPDGTTYSEQL